MEILVVADVVVVVVIVTTAVAIVFVVVAGQNVLPHTARRLLFTMKSTEAAHYTANNKLNAYLQCKRNATARIEINNFKSKRRYEIF